MLTQVCRFLLTQMNAAGINHNNSFQLINRSHTVLTRYVANKLFDNQVHTGLVKSETHEKGLRQSSPCTYIKLFSHRKQRIAVTIFLLLYLRIKSSRTFDVRSVLIALAKMQSFLHKEHFTELGITPITPDQAIFIAMEWSKENISLEYCPDCGSIFASINVDADSEHAQAIHKRMNRCPTCIMMHTKNSFGSKKVSEEIQQALITNVVVTKNRTQNVCC